MLRVEIRLLGPIGATVDGAPVAVGGLRQRALLALLALDAGHVVSAGRIITEVWGADAGTNPHNAVQAAVSRLRKVLGAQAVLARGAGYVLDVPSDAVDAARFERACTAARRKLAQGDAAAAETLLSGALGLWEGDALEELHGHEFARIAATRLDEQRSTAEEDLADARLASGRHAELVADLQAAVDAQPLRERRHAQLMLALYRSGRQADALRAYQSARETLAGQLGIEPGPELRELERRILEQDPALGAAQVAAVAAPPPAPSARIPAPRTSFVGRRDELDSLTALLATSRLVTVVGPGGAGKTRLATELARRGAGERPVRVVELAPVTDADEVAEVTATAIGAIPAAGGHGAAPAAADPIARIVQHVGDRPMLLVVDNCEHVVDAAAGVVDALLDACPGLTVLATSREGLRIAGEQLWPLPPLASDDAVELFAARARAAKPTFALDGGTEPVVREICARLDGLPLAIELAAARTRVLPVDDLAARLDDRFRLLTGGNRTALARQQTLEAVVDWSYDLLFDTERRLFARLSVFAGGATIDAAELVTGFGDVPAEEVSELLARLVDKSLVVVDTEGAGAPRFTMLETLREYAAARLDELGDRDETERRHGTWFADLAHRADPELRGAGQREWLPRLDAEVENLRVALERAVSRGDVNTAATIAARTTWYWFLRGRSEEAQRWLTLVDAGTVEPGTRAWVDLWSGFVDHRLGDEAARRRVGAAAEYFERSGGADEHALALVAYAATAMRAGSRDELRTLLDRARTVANEVGSTWACAVVNLLESDVAQAAGDHERATRVTRDGLEQFRAIGDDWGIAQLTMALGHLLEAQGEYDEARDAYARSLEVAEQAGLAEYESNMTAHLGNIATLCGDHDRARRLHDRALERCRDLGVTTYAFALTSAGFGARRAGDLARARACFEEAAGLYRTSGWVAGHAQALDGLGLVAELEGDDATAVELHREAYELVRDRGMPRAVAHAVEGLAAALARSDPERAGRLLGAAAVLRERSGGPLPAGERVDVERAERAVERALGDDGLQRARRSGRLAVDQLPALVAGAGTGPGER